MAQIFLSLARISHHAWTYWGICRKGGALAPPRDGLFWSALARRPRRLRSQAARAASQKDTWERPETAGLKPRPSLTQ